ncbi:MAG: phage major tail tube protein [Proteobacteria bacterium]|nr:phage major tail tube protein [Pseudomonadota bacterium]
MASTNVQRDKLINYTVFVEGNRKLGTADITLPTISYNTDTLSGAGIAGEVDMPTLGHTDSMEVEINWRIVTGDLAVLIEPRGHNLEFRGSNQIYDEGNNEFKTSPVVVSVRALPKEGSLGKLEAMSTADASNTLEVTYLKVEIAGETKIEIDKLNFIHMINGTDYLASVRSDLGL